VALFPCDAQLSDVNYSEQLTFRETKEVAAIIERIAKKEGQQVGALARTGLRRYLRSRDDLTDQEKKTLGLNDQTK
jgi:hypothetical protein